MSSKGPGSRGSLLSSRFSFWSLVYGLRRRVNLDRGCMESGLRDLVDRLYCHIYEQGKQGKALMLYTFINEERVTVRSESSYLFPYIGVDRSLDKKGHRSGCR